MRLHVAKRLPQGGIDTIVNAIKGQYPDMIIDVAQDDDTQGDDVAIEMLGTVYVVEEGDVLTKDQLVREFITGDHHVTIIIPT